MKGTIAIIAIAATALLLGAMYLFVPSRQIPVAVKTEATSTPTSDDTEPSRVTIQIHINQGVSGLGITVLPLGVTEDSRCPMEVQCVWAGTVKVHTTLTTPSGVGEQLFELGKPITTETRTITLVDVLPRTRTGNTISASDYTFVFEVKKRTDL